MFNLHILMFWPSNSHFVEEMEVVRHCNVLNFVQGVNQVING